MGSSMSCSSRSRPGWAYDVFLSFRGEDTRKNFTDHLYSALIQAGIRTFRDNDELPRGEDISSHILKAIEESKISILVFSKGYASSTWCLDELVKILDCKRTTAQIVLPVFYHIDPSHVRKQERSFAEAFGRYEERFKDEIEKVNKWKGALVEAANLSGWDLHTVANGHESEFVKKIVEEVSSNLNPRYMKVATYPVGIDSQVNDIIVSLDVGLDDVRVLGIYGMPGIGKTAMAKALFNQLCCKFEGSCCLLNIKNIAEQPNGLVQLQKQLLWDTLKQDFWNGDFERGINLIKERFSQKRVLIVLDDLDHLGQVNALVGGRNWFGCGSRIIITTRDEHLRTQLEVNKKYQAKELNHEESLQLFSWHAFREPHPIKDYFELSKWVVHYAGGLPLALEVLGGFLFRRSIPEWRSTIEKLQKIPDIKIQSHLKTSFDSLDDDKLKDMFLDIACFFIGMDKDYVAKILDVRGFFSQIGLSVLIERSLVTINNQNELKMHDLLRDMGREIVRETSPKHPGRRSRLWYDEEVLDVLKRHMGTEVVEGLILDVEASKHVALSTESFANMKYLQLLQCNGVHLNGYYEQLSKELIWLCWHKCPLQSLPPDFLLDNLVVLDMQYSHIEEVWKEINFLNKLKIFNLSHSVYLIKTPTFTGLSSLESLILEGCRSLVEVHHSIGHLERLVFLNLEGCGKLENLPESICYLKSLETLNISMCRSLRILPENLGKLENLRNLLLASYQEEVVQCSYSGPIYSEIVIKFPPFLPASFVGLSSLIRLDLSDRNLSDVDISINLGTLSSLQDLNLARNKFFTLPTGIGRLPKLERLNLSECRNLQSILDLPLSLNTLVANYLTSLEKLSIRSTKVPDLLLSGCKKLLGIEGLDNVENKPVIYMANCKNLSNNFKKILLQLLSKGKLPDIVFPGSEVPDWFSDRGHGSSISFYLPAISSSEIQGLIVWAVYAESAYLYWEEDFCTSAIIRKKSNGTELFYTPSYFPMFSYHKKQQSWVIYIPFSQLACAVEVGEELEVSVKAGVNNTVRKCGVELAGSFGKPVTSWNYFKYKPTTLTKSMIKELISIFIFLSCMLLLECL